MRFELPVTLRLTVLVDAAVANPLAIVLAKETFFSVGAVVYSADGGAGAGYHNVATSYTGFTIFPQAGTFTGGTISVYGYAK